MAWHDIIALELYARSDNIERSMISYPLDVKHGRMTSGVTCHHRLWEHTRLNDVGRGMPLYPLDGKHGRTRSGVTCYHRLWATHTVERRWAWHDITAFGKHTRSNDVGRDMPTPPLDSQHGRTTSSMAFHYRLWPAHTVERRLSWHAIIALRQHKRSNDVRRGMTSPP